MTQKQRNVLIGIVRSLSPEVLLEATDRCDGHTIIDPKAFTEAGMPDSVVEYLTTIHHSDGSPKGTIFVKGQAVKELKGIYGLDTLRFIAEALNVQYESKLGRGSQAQTIQRALHQHFQKLGQADPAV